MCDPKIPIICSSYSSFGRNGKKLGARQLTKVQLFEKVVVVRSKNLKGVWKNSQHFFTHLDI